MDGTVMESEITENVERNTLKDIGDGTGSDKVDSGMDDDSQHSNEAQEQGDDSDNEDEIIIRKPNKKRALLLDEDDESSKDSMSATSEEKESKTVNCSDSDNSDSGDDSDKEDTVDKQPSTSSQGTSSGTLFGNTDLFDAESDSDKGDNSDDDGGDNRNSGDESGSDSNSNDEADDEGFDENSIDPKLLKKLKQGAAKQSPKKSKRQAKKEEMLKLHGETQRIIRESSVRLPYHQPSPKSLNDFLARANKKQQEYKMLKGGVRDLQKAKALQEILTKTKIVSQKHDTSKSEDDDDDPDYIPESSSNSKCETKEQPNTTADCEMKADSADTEDIKAASQGDNQGSNDGDDDDDFDNLPDLVVEQSITSEKSHDTGEKNTNSNKPNVTSDKMCESAETVHTENDKNDITNSVNLDVQEQGSSANSELSVENKTTDNSDDTSNGITSETSLKNDKQKQNEEVDNTQCNSSQNQPESMEVCDDETSLNCVKSSEQSEVLTSQDNMSKHLTPKLSGLPELNVLPRLSGGPDSFIDLDDEKEKKTTPRNPGVSRLMDRLIKHSQKKKKKHAKDVDISIIQKEKVTTEKEELKMNTFTYHTEEDEENSLMKLEAPGAKLQALKVQLKEKMKVKREEARQKRQEIFDLDNEEGYVDEDNPLEALDEEELSDRSDTDVEDDEFDEEFGDEEYIEEEEEEKKTNLFVDGEASEDDEDYVPGGDNSEDEDEMSLRLHLSDEDEEDDDEEGQEEKEDFKEKKVLSVKKKPRVLQISDDESSCSNIIGQEKTNADIVTAEDGKDNKNKEVNKDDDFSPFSKHLPQTVSPIRIKSKRSSLSLPIEDSMDLYGTTDDVPSTAIESTQSLNFYLEDSQSQMLDADGFLKVGSAVKPPKKMSAIAQLENSNTQDNMDDFFGLCSGKFTSKESNNKSKTGSAFGEIGTSNTQDNMDELLGLCSGRFAESQVNKEQSCNKSLFTQNKEYSGKKKGVFDFDQSSKTQKNMEELMGLCSGKFTTTKNSQTTTTQKSGVKRKSVFDEDEDSNDSFKILSDGEEEEDKSDKDKLSDTEDKEEKNALSDEDDDVDEVDDDTNMRQSDDEEAEFRKPEKFKGFTIKNKHGKIRKDFVEDEAELSGSEYDSDENYDIAEDEDILEMEEGDKDVQMPESELRDQVGRVHLKQLIDEDKRELLRFQEMYLPDGDLHSEGGGRTRKFKWKDIDDDTQQDIFNDSDGEKEEEENENDYNWRKERFEREKWLQENQENEMMDDEGSQFLKLGKVFFKRQNSESQSQNITLQQPKTTTDKKKDSSPTPKLFKLTAKQKRGSFLTRDKQTLAKIAETTKSDLKVNGAKNSKNFVFTVISPDKDKNTETESMPAPSERKVRKALQPTHKQPAAKKRKVGEDTSSQNSIFNHI